MTFDPKEARVLADELHHRMRMSDCWCPNRRAAASLTAALDEIERLRVALGDVIDCDHHNFTDGPPPRYVRIARSALKGADQ